MREQIPDAYCWFLWSTPQVAQFSEKLLPLKRAPGHHPDLLLCTTQTAPGAGAASRPFYQAPKQHSQPELLKQHPTPEMHPNARFQCMKSPLAPPLGKKQTRHNSKQKHPLALYGSRRYIVRFIQYSNLNYAFLKPYIPPLVRLSSPI